MSAISEGEIIDMNLMISNGKRDPKNRMCPIKLENESEDSKLNVYNVNFNDKDKPS